MQMYDIIDIHAHIFPDKIAEKAASFDRQILRGKMRHNGTVENLLKSGSRINVSRCVVHSSATVVEQVMAINDYIAETQASHPEITGFATLHRAEGCGCRS